MSMLSPTSYFSETIESNSSRAESPNKQEIFSDSLERSNQEGFSSSMILNIENDVDSKPCSKLINITQIIPGTQRSKKLLLPVFYRRNNASMHEKSLLFIEQESPNKTPSNESLKEFTESKGHRRPEVTKPNRATATTFGSMHSLSNIDVEPNHEFFSEHINYGYEQELKSSMHEGNIIAYCHNCKKETVTIMKPETFKGIKGWKDILLCCCSSWNTKTKAYACPTCSEILLKTN